MLHYLLKANKLHIQATHLKTVMFCGQTFELGLSTEIGFLFTSLILYKGILGPFFLYKM